MNSFTNGAAPAQQAPQEDDDSINLLELLDVVLDQRWLILSIAAIVLALGGVYAFLAAPTFEANTLIQVEETKGGNLNSMLGDASALFDIRSSTAAEIEILRSRLVVGQAVVNLQLDLTVSPKYVPFVGAWLARRANSPSEPGFLGLSGYVRGNEALKISSLVVPKALEGRRYTVVLTEQGYALRSPEGDTLGQGLIGQPLPFKDEGQAGELLVASAIGKPGAEFYVQISSRLAITERLQNRLKIVEQGRQSGIIRISLDGANPAATARILNEVGALYVRQNVERKSAEAEKTIAFLNTQLPQLRAELETSEGKFNQFRNQNGTFDLGAEAKLMLDQAVSLRVKLLDLTQKRKELETRFTAQHPSVQALDAQVRSLSSEISRLEGKSKTLPNVEQDLLRLTRDVKVNNELYTSLLNSFQQLRLVKEGKVGNVRIVDAAPVPERPIRPQRGLVLAVAAALGLLLGVALAFLRNRLSQGIKEPGVIEQQLGVHVFASVPHSGEQEALNVDIKAQKSGLHLLANQRPDDPGIESLRSLRTALQFAMLDAPNNVVLITGPTPGIGKSFISSNFAAVLGAGGKRVLLIDADLRKGHIHSTFGLKRGLGMSELIVGSQPLDVVLHKNVSPQVDLITTGTLPPNPAELLMSPATARTLKNLSGQYDIVLIDTPPVLVVSDTQELVAQAGTVFLVARAEVSTLGELQETGKRLNQAGVAVRGVIFNDLDITKRRYGYGYGYGYKYSQYRYRKYEYGKTN